MAEQVQAIMDRMVAPLKDLQDRCIFSPAEIHAIVDRRRESEYSLQRKKPRKSDYLRYLQAEMDLEKLRVLRTKRLKREQREQQARKKKKKREEQRGGGSDSGKIGDRHVVQHIHLLWTRALRRYRGDVSLYLQYADFMKRQRSYKRLGSLYAQALQVHPKETGLWIEAASHEFFEAGGSVQNARVLLQRGLRINPTSQDLWVQSFALELHFVQKMRGRRKILMGGDDADDNSEQQQQQGGDIGEKIPPRDDASKDEAASHAIALVVYNNAIAAVSDDVAFRQRFVDQCHLFPATSSLREHIVSTIRRDCEEKPEAWIARATYELRKRQNHDNEGEEHRGGGFARTLNASDDDEEDATGEPSAKRQKSAPRESSSETPISPVLAILKEATDKIPTEDMYVQVIDFIGSCTQQLVADDDDEEQGDEDESSRHELLEACNDFLDDVFEQVSSLDAVYTPRLALAYSTHLQENEKTDKAIGTLHNFCRRFPEKADARLWTSFAGLVFPDPSAVSILEQALEKIPLHQSDHMVILLQLLGAKLQLSKRVNSYCSDDLRDLMDRILLLAPGFIDMDDVEYSPFGVHNTLGACLAYLHHVIKTGGLDGARKVYRAVLYESSFIPRLARRHPDILEMFIDTAIEAEASQCPAQKQRQRNLERLFDTAVKLFSGTALGDKYRQRRDDECRYGTTSASQRGLASLKFSPSCRNKGKGLLAIPTFDVSSPDFRPEEFHAAFQTFKLVKLVAAARKRRDAMTWKEVNQIFQDINAEDRKSWCIETKGAAHVSADDFLTGSSSSTRGYCSFLIQKDKKAYGQTLDRLPLKTLTWTSWSYEPCLWLFFGRNPIGNCDLEGRPEHTDSISHDGTWHFQLSGRKQWFLRPTPRLLDHLHGCLPAKERQLWRESSRLRLECSQGDVIIINTKLWFHRTVIPPQKEPSVSYARDFRCQGSLVEGDSGGMTNLDGLYATEDIEKGTVVFTEKSMPDCELHRSSVNPNCEVVELDDGTSAVVSSRLVSAGEFFCVPESTDEEDLLEDSDGETVE